jgi:succinate-acetate transporter protein
MKQKIRNMKEKLLKDLPIYLNGFAVGMLLFSISNIQLIDVCMFLLADITFFWYGTNAKKTS